MENNKETSFLSDFIYYGSNDFYGSFFVKNVCDNIIYLEKNFQILNKEIQGIEDMYHFLWCVSLKKMVSEIDNYNLDKDLKQRIIVLADKIKPVVLSFISYINDNYLVIFDKQNHDEKKWGRFFYYVLDLCYGYYSKKINDDVFRFFESKFPLHILSRFSSCSKYYSKHIEEFKNLFKDLKKTQLFDDKVYLRFLTNATSRTDEFLKTQATFICERTVKAIKEMHLTEDSQEIIQIQSQIQEYEKLAIQFKLKCANEYNILSKNIRETLDKFIKKHGVHRTIGPIDLEPALALLKSDKNENRFIQLTHVINKNGQLENAFDYIINATNENNRLSEAADDISRNRSNKEIL